MSQGKTAICPECLTEFPLTKSVNVRHKMMASLANEGFGLREIGRIFGEHPQTVKYWSIKLANLEKGE